MQPASLIIPTYNAVGQIEGLLTRLKHFHEKYCDACEVIIADDASTDGTQRMITKGYPWIKLVANEQNRGYGPNVMSGVEQAQLDYLVVINSDIEVIGNPFYHLFDELEKNDKLFAAMPLVFNRPHDKVENLQHLVPSRGLVWNTDLPEAEEWTSIMRDLLTRAVAIKDRLRDVGGSYKPIRSMLCGAAFACRRDRFNELGGFDPRFQPFYWEDVDLDYRARRKGWHCCVVPRCAVIHRHSETINRFHRSRKMRYLLHNQLRFVIAHLDQLEGLSQPHIWWGLRSVKELFSGNTELARAYFRAGAGYTDV